MQFLFPTLYFIIALSYIVLTFMGYTQSSFILLKIIPIYMLIVYVYKHQLKFRFLLCFALLFSSFGDMFLGYDRVRMFIPGLISFLIAHIFYILLFKKVYQFRKEKMKYLIGLIFYSLSFAIIILIRVKSTLLAPVLLYLIVISVMVSYSLFNCYNNRRLIWGAVIFLVSDSFIAINKFVMPFSYSIIAILLTYYLAQYLIVNSFAFILKNEST